MKAPLVLALLIAVPALAQGAVRLTTQWRGPDMCLDVVNGGEKNNTVKFTPCGDYSGQQWRILETREGYKRLTTRFRGAGMCLDLANGGPRNLQGQLTRCSNASGQLWQFRPVDD